VIHCLFREQIIVGSGQGAYWPKEFVFGTLPERVPAPCTLSLNTGCEEPMRGSRRQRKDRQMCAGPDRASRDLTNGRILCQIIVKALFCGPKRCMQAGDARFAVPESGAYLARSPQPDRAYGRPDVLMGFHTLFLPRVIVRPSSRTQKPLGHVASTRTVRQPGEHSRQRCLRRGTLAAPGDPWRAIVFCCCQEPPCALDARSSTTATAMKASVSGTSPRRAARDGLGVLLGPLLLLSVSELRPDHVLC
jgi:hypothetical protein